METFIVFVGVFALVCAVWFLSRTQSRSPGIVTIQDDVPYSVFSREFDVETRGRDVERFLDPELQHHYPGEGLLRDFASRMELALRTLQASNAKADLEQLPRVDKGTTAIALLVDQSGSMADRIPLVAAEIKASCEAIEERGFSVGLFGHTTRGWRGGQSRKAWLSKGVPAFPGRLADLLHIVYKDFDTVLCDEDWSAMMLANALHENIDGEALEWVAAKLASRPEPNRILIVISDGASVDDSTLQANGLGYLERHLLDVIEDIEADERIELTAIGVDHSVQRYYRSSVQISEPKALPNALLSVIVEACDKTGQRNDRLPPSL